MLKWIVCAVRGGPGAAGGEQRRRLWYVHADTWPEAIKRLEGMDLRRDLAPGERTVVDRNPTVFTDGLQSRP